MTTLKSDVNTESPSSFAVIQGRVYMANDFDKMQVWDGVAAQTYDAGMAAPATVAGTPTVTAGATTAGIHLIRYRYYNTRSLYVSNPSPILTLTVPVGGSTLTFTVGTHLVASADAKCDKIMVEATTAGGSKYYLVGTCNNTAAATLAYNVADTSHIQSTAVAASPGDYGHEQPPLCSLVVSHRGILFGAGSTTKTRTVGVTNGSGAVTGTGFSLSWAGRRFLVAGDGVSYEVSAVASATAMTIAPVYAGSTNTAAIVTVFPRTPNRLYWSRTLYPEGWKPSEYARDTLNNKSDELRGLSSYSGDLWVFGRHSAERLVFTSDPGTSEGQVIPIPGDRGVHNQRCLVEASGKLYAWDRLGMYQCGAIPQHISKPIDRTLVDYVDWAYYDDFHGVYDPTDGVLMWFFTNIGDTVPKYAACMEVSSGRWFLSSFQQGVTASLVVPDSEGQVRAMLGDANGYTWFYGIEGGLDGVPPATTAVLTITGTPTATQISVTPSMSVNPTLSGCVLYNPANGETATVDTNTSSLLTMVSPGFTTVPTTGTELWAGRIPFEYETKWLSLAGVQTRVVYLHMHVHPSSATGSARVYIYRNFSATAEVFTSTASDTFPDGVTVTNGASYIAVSLDGHDGDGILTIPLPCDWATSWKARVVCDRPDGELRLLHLEFSTMPDTKQAAS